MWSVVAECAYLIPHLHICSDWLITKKSNIQSSVWATLMKLGMRVVMGTSTTHVVCCHQMRIFNTSFAYLFQLTNFQTKEIHNFRRHTQIEYPSKRIDLYSSIM